MEARSDSEERASCETSYDDTYSQAMLLTIFNPQPNAKEPKKDSEDEQLREFNQQEFSLSTSAELKNKFKFSGNKRRGQLTAEDEKKQECYGVQAGIKPKANNKKSKNRKKASSSENSTSYSIKKKF